MEKQIRVKFDTSVHHTSVTLDYVHTNMWGPTKVALFGGRHYFVSFVND